MLRGRSARKTANRDGSRSVHNVIQLHASTPLVCDVRRILWFPAFRVRLFLRSYGPRLTGLIYANSFSFLESRLPAARTPSEKRRENRPFRTGPADDETIISRHVVTTEPFVGSPRTRSTANIRDP